ncbi:hypothetical protein [Methyloversatilis thermotolerans]|uniref:hypothetical protein n=1 Tax=Methyloversatilis thermotolerans TaxID=1346290 RepID=UPI00037AFEF2|nr:hypothetical protein [Methyloversatilis thermotolerans]
MADPDSAMDSMTFRSTLPHTLAVLALLAVVLLWPRAELRDSLPTRVVVPPPCRLERDRCRADIADGRQVLLSLMPRPVPAGTPFRALLQLRGFDAEEAALEFDGVDMSMGVYREALRRDASGQWSAAVTLPVCVTGAMRWNARLFVVTRSERLELPFRLQTGSAQAAAPAS